MIINNTQPVPDGADSSADIMAMVTLLRLSLLGGILQKILMNHMMFMTKTVNFIIKKKKSQRMSILVI